MKLNHEKIKQGYEIICNLYKGNFKYTLYFDDNPIYSFKDKTCPEDLPKNGKINRMLNKISIDVGTSSEIRNIKNDLYDDIVNNLECTLLENEYIFDKYQQTNGCVYNHKNTILFYFMVKNVKKYEGDIYEVTIIQQDKSIYTIKDKLNDIIDELVYKNLILVNYNNYGFVFNMLINTVLLNG